MSSPSSLPRPVVSGEPSIAGIRQSKNSPFAPDLSRIREISAPRKASIRDVNGMSALINEFAARGIMLARGPLYLYQSIQDYRVMTMPASDGTERVVACGGLHVLWEDLAEVRSVAVHPALQKSGLGRAMVEALLDDARRLEVRRAFTFTLAEGFFRSLDFAVIPRDQLPPVVWAECSKCPKYYKCDEVGMIRPLLSPSE
ncbi:MAG TPA: N-acetyltransferase [Candidatus Mailhella excrementigallinarum]|nr:MAG: N-acetyltransferase [Desulfovibrionaceae bacterium]HIV66646.1 N-acetyltransferase [Candidatus Mailhella excrementigallinarum]